MARKRGAIRSHGSFARRPEHENPCSGGRYRSPYPTQIDRGTGSRWPFRRKYVRDADRAYDSDGLREALAARGACAKIRPMPNRVNVPVFNRTTYKLRNRIERFFSKLKHFRAVATRYDKRDDNFLASAQLASLRIWLRTYESVT